MSKYFIAKLKWLEPVEETDKMKKISKRFLVRADSVTEAEANVVKWTPGNYQDPVVKGVSESDIIDIIKNGDSETFWLITMSDENDKGRFVPFNFIINGGDELAVLKKVTSETYRTSQFESMKRLKVVVDEDLISETPVASRKSNAPATSDEDIDDDGSDDEPF